MHLGIPAVEHKFEKLPRLVFSVRHFHPHEGGSEIQARRLAANLVQGGVSVIILTGRYGRQPRREMIDGVPVYRLFIGVYLPFVHEIFYLASLTWQLFLRRNEYDIVFLFQTNLSAFVATVISDVLKKQVITRGSSTGPESISAYWAAIPFGQRILSYIRAHVDAAIGVSITMVSDFIAAGFGREKVHYIPNGVPIISVSHEQRQRLRASLAFSSDSVVVVFVGKLIKIKAPGLVLDAWQRMGGKYKNVRLIYLGDGELLGQLESRVNSERWLSESVEFAGRVENVNDYLLAADIFVLPSLYEGLSNALLEAMAAELPVVASRVSGAIDIIRHRENGMLFDVGDARLLEHCLSDLIEFPHLRRELGKQARHTIEVHFSLEAITNQYMSLYQTLMDKS